MYSPGPFSPQPLPGDISIMATIFDLNAQTRQRNGSAAVRRLRKEGLIPAVVYGRKVDASNIKVDGKAFSQLLGQSASDNVLVNLKIEGGKGDQLALVQQVQHDHLRGGILHVDFHAVDMNEEIHAQVPLELTGECEGVKLGGLLELHHHTLEVHCLPKDLPNKISVDISSLGIGSSVHVREIPLPQGVRVHLDGDVVVLAVSEPKVAEEPASAAAAPAAGAAAPAAAAAPAKK